MKGASMNHASSHHGKGMREPKLTQRNYLIQSNLTRLLRTCIHRFLSGKDLQILDCGCGEKPYLPFFENISSLYIGIDRTRGKQVDIVCDVEKLPLRSQYFNVVLCTQVIEHVTSPETLINEIQRVLKNDGYLFLSTHGVWPVHAAPFDFWRWTDFGLKKMLEDFSMVKIYECGGNIASFFQIMNLYLPTIPYLRSILSLFLNIIGESLDNKFRGKSAKLIVNYLAIAKK
jgi:SAM-dependent methyltransferase